MPLYEEITLDRDDVRVRKCWWVSGCCSKEVPLTSSSPIPKYNKLGTRKLTEAEVEAEKERRRNQEPLTVTQRYIVEVTEKEARTGLGRKCPNCGKKMGCYVCDGFPTFQGSVVFKETEKDAKGPE